MFCILQCRLKICISFLKTRGLAALELTVYNKKYFSYFSTKTYVVRTQKNHLNEMVFWAPKTYVKTDG